VTAFSNLGMRAQRTLKPDKTSNPQLLVTLLFGRALTSLQSVAIARPYRARCIWRMPIAEPMPVARTAAGYKVGPTVS
jgi:hypothetical protein